MAFSERYTTAQTENCPICRRQYTEGRSILNSVYWEGTRKMCRSCYKRYYKDAAEIENKSNLLVQLRPADILERGRILRRPQPPGGYEFRMPHILAEQIIRDVAVWLLLFFGIWLVLAAGTDSLSYMSVSDSLIWQLFRWAGILTAGLGLLRYGWQLLKGLFLGMGHSRRLVLLAAMVIMILIIGILIA